MATDASAEALAVAERNSAALGLATRNLQFVESDWFNAVEGQFDLIVSNPPYIASDDPHLAALRHEPIAALTAGTDGLADLQAIIAQAPACLRPGGWLLLEHGYNQADAVAAALHSAGFEQVQHRFDLGGIARCTGGCRPE